jgi:uncharacterized membrane protein YkvA (DUF1232 family)
MGDKLAQSAGELSNKVAHSAEELAQSAGELRDKVASSAGEMSENFLQSAGELGVKMAHSAGELSENVVHSAGEINEKVVAYISENGEKLKQFYSDSKLLEKIQGALKTAGAMVLYPVMILFNLMRSPSTSVQDKMMIVAPLAYFILPTDLIPDYLVGAGYIDDGAAIMTCLQKVSTLITSELIEQTNKQYQQMIGKVDEEVFDKITKQIKGGQDTSSDN